MYIPYDDFEFERDPDSALVSYVSCMRYNAFYKIINPVDDLSYVFSYSEYCLNDNTNRPMCPLIDPILLWLEEI